MDEEYRIPFKPRDVIAQRLIKPLPKTEIRYRHGHVAITNYKLGDNWAFEKYISTWDNWKYKMVGGFYYREVKELRIPRGYSLETLKTFFPPNQYPYVLDNYANEAWDAEIKLFYPPNKDIQKLVLAHVLGVPPYESKKKYTQHAVDMDTGDGKTYTAVAIQAALEKRAIIFVPTKVIADQWIDSIHKFTSITKKELCFINSGKVALDVARGHYKDCKVYLVMQGSFASLISTHGAYMGERMIAETKAYLKVVDEIHMNLKKVMTIEALANCKLNLYLSATFDRADRTERLIFNKCFRDTPRIGIGMKQKEEAHLNMVIGEYEWKPSNRAQGAFNTPKGVSPTAYEKEFLREGKHIIKGSLSKMMKSYDKVAKPDSRTLIMTSSIDGIEYIAEVVKDLYPNKTVGTYHSKLSKKDREKNIQADIIISTVKGLGTGTDIPKLQFIHNFATYSNQKDSKQFSGRGRSIEGLDVFYNEYVNIGYFKTARQFESRKAALIKKATKGKLHHINLQGNY